MGAHRCGCDAVPRPGDVGLSGSAIRLGICLGNGTALAYERVPGLHEMLVRPTFVVLVAVVAGLLITMVRQEYAIEELTRSPQAESELAAIANSVAEEFLLSERERELPAFPSPSGR